MKNLSNYFVSVSFFLIILLWIYAATSKLIDFPHFKYEMHNQVLFPFMQKAMIYLLPATEFIIASLLIFEKTSMTGLYLSLLLLTLFTGYIALVIFQVFRKVPCSCGGILEHMGWSAHLFFNLTYLSLMIVTLFVLKKKGGAQATK